MGDITRKEGYALAFGGSLGTASMPLALYLNVEVFKSCNYYFGCGLSYTLIGVILAFVFAYLFHHNTKFKILNKT